MGKLLIRCMKCKGEHYAEVGINSHLGCQECGNFIMQFDERAVVVCVKCGERKRLSAGDEFNSFHDKCRGRIWTIEEVIGKKILETLQARC